MSGPYPSSPSNILKATFFSSFGCFLYVRNVLKLMDINRPQLIDDISFLYCQQRIFLYPFYSALILLL